MLDPQTIGWLSLVLMLMLLGLGIPIYIVLAALGFIGYWLIEGQARAFAVVALIPYSKLAIYTFTVVPLFIFMGNMVFAAGASARTFTLPVACGSRAYRVDWLRGRLALALCSERYADRALPVPLHSPG